MRNPFKGFLEKRNTRATRRSVARRAALGAIGGALLGALNLMFAEQHQGFEESTAIAMPAMIVIGAIAAAAIEWQGGC